MQTGEVQTSLSVWRALKDAQPSVTIHQERYCTVAVGVRIHIAEFGLVNALKWEDLLYDQIAMLVIADQRRQSVRMVAGVLHKHCDPQEMDALFQPDQAAELRALSLCVDREFEGYSNALKLLVLPKDNLSASFPNLRFRLTP